MKTATEQLNTGKTIISADHTQQGSDDENGLHLVLSDGTLLCLTVNTVIKGDDVYGAGIGTISYMTYPAFGSFVGHSITRFENFSEMSEDDKNEFVPWLADYEGEGQDMNDSVFIVLDDGTRIDGTLVAIEAAA